MRLIAAATDPRALACLEVFSRPPHRLLALITAPDRPKGRGRAAEPSPLALWAWERKIPLLQPEDINHPEILAWITEKAAPRLEALAVIAYGQKLGPDLLALPVHGCLNLHPSLLPKYRGAAPIPRAILAGDTETGVCVIRMEDRMDAGPVLAMKKEPILPEDTAATLGERLFAAGAELFRGVLDSLPNEGRPQDDAKATRAPMLRKEEGRIDWKLSAAEIALKVRGLQPWPGAFSTLQHEGLRLSIRGGRAIKGSGEPGTLLPGPGMHVACGKGVLDVTEVQAEGKRPMPAGDFLRGTRLVPGARFA